MSHIPVSPKYGVNPAIPKCYYCWEDKNEIILPGQLQGDVEAPRNAVWDLNPCDKCEKFMKQGVILISIRDEEEAPPPLPPLSRTATAAQKAERMRVLMWNPYRTGGWVVVKDAAVRRIFTPPELVANILKKRYAFVQHMVFVQLGLPVPPPAN